MNKRLVPLIPFLLITAIMIYTWSNLLFGDYIIQVAQWLGLGFYFLTLFIYFGNFKYGTLMTGVTLFIATFNVISFFADIMYISFGAGFGDNNIYTPGIQPFSLLILILYIIINFSFLKNFWEEIGPESSAKK